jgi:AraC family transcriptional regulator
VEPLALETILPILVRIQCSLEQDLSLLTLARAAGVSPHHFHRVFKRSTGESLKLKAYTQRLRVEHAALALVLQEASILEVALSCGFQCHETFSRAFKRHFGTTPREYRASGRRARSTGPTLPRPRAALASPRLSATRVCTLGEVHVAFIRHTGPYESVPPRSFEDLVAWKERCGPAGDTVFMGIAHDAPGITPARRLRFDVALRVPRAFMPEGRIGHQVVGRGLHATTRYMGPPAGLKEAYDTIFRQRLRALEGFETVGLPTIEVYRTTEATREVDLASTEILVPIARRRARSRSAGPR